MCWAKGLKESSIQRNIIFAGMNMADNSTDSVHLGNYHSKVQKHGDYRLRDAIMGTSFKGSYMTDVFSRKGQNSKQVEEYYKDHPDELEGDIRAFIDECRKLYKGTKYVICIGKSFHCVKLKKYYLNNKEELKDFVFMYKGSNEMFSIPHHSGMARRYYRTDKAYINAVQEKLERISLEINK